MHFLLLKCDESRGNDLYLAYGFDTILFSLKADELRYNKIQPALMIHNGGLMGTGWRHVETAIINTTTRTQAHTRTQTHS